MAEARNLQPAPAGKEARNDCNEGTSDSAQLSTTERIVKMAAAQNECRQSVTTTASFASGKDRKPWNPACRNLAK
jgi:hypothetical protein